MSNINNIMSTKIQFTDEEKNNKEKFYWKLLHYKLFGDFYGIEMKKVSNDDIFLKYDIKRIDMDKYFEVNSDDYLLKNEFEFKGESKFDVLWKYLNINENVILAGGYMTSMLFDINIFPNSDIDLFIKKDSVMEVIDFIRNNFNVIRYEKLCSLVMNIVLDNEMRNIQIIVKDFNKVSDLLDDFDMCHSKCAYYMGNVYHTYDAEYAKENKVTISFQNVRVDRKEKAEKYGLKLFNKSIYYRELKNEKDFINYFDYDLRSSTDYNSNESMENMIVVTDTFNTKFFNNFGISNNCDNHYSFDFYEFTDEILYKEINIDDIDFFDLSDVIIKPTRYNYSCYNNMYKMVPFNEYFKVPCILYFTVNVDYNIVKDTVIYGTNMKTGVHLSGIQDYLKLCRNIGKLIKKIDNNTGFLITYDRHNHNNNKRNLELNNIIDIEAAYNNIESIKNKTSQKLCLIFCKYEKLTWEIIFNLFPYS
jgi:hypothetical protein